LACNPVYPSVRVLDPRKGGAKGGFVLIAVSPHGACSFHTLPVRSLGREEVDI
jgi:hypothetical protein